MYTDSDVYVHLNVFLCVCGRVFFFQCDCVCITSCVHVELKTLCFHLRHHILHAHMCMHIFNITHVCLALEHLHTLAYRYMKYFTTTEVVTFLLSLY